jgi:hypothetical protein
MFYHLGGEKTTGRGEEGSPLVSCARATRDLGRMRGIARCPFCSQSAEGMEPDDLLCSRNARPQNEARDQADRSFCSQSPHDKAVVARCAQ